MTVSVKDIELAKNGRKIFGSRSKAKMLINSKPVSLPTQVERALKQALSFVAEGKDVIVVPESAELSTQQVADLLKVSRPFVVKLLENEEIPFRRVGKHRRVLAADALKYKERIDNKRIKVLEKLAAEAQELGFGY
ncbi:MAG: excisionase family DNA-binding protein [Pyrinomonadaceae bacterium]